MMTMKLTLTTVNFIPMKVLIKHMKNYLEK